MKNIYPALIGGGLPEIKQWVLKVTQLRQQEDLPDYVNQKNIYVSGRTTMRVPSSAIDVVNGDRLGDTVTAVDGSYQYTLVSVSGTYKWARVALDSVW